MFLFNHWDEFCRKLNNNSIASLTASMLIDEKPDSQFILLKHDVETNPIKALRMAQIESKYALRGTYYVQAYLLNNKQNIEVLKQIQELGHEVSYHHDVMDSNKGDIKRAANEFQKNIEMFQKNGFYIKTVCQHGNPIIERVGYNSNRDLFRNNDISLRYNHITEIMVNFKFILGREYKYISDAGYGWKIIFDPENNDILNSDEKDILLETLDGVLEVIESGFSTIISTHPHRWYRSACIAIIKDYVFKAIKVVVNGMLKFPYMKKLLGRFYYLAKKI